MWVAGTAPGIISPFRRRGGDNICHFRRRKGYVIMRATFLAVVVGGLLVTAGSASAEVFDTGGFEGYTLGSVIGQSVGGGYTGAPEWELDAMGRPPVIPKIVVDPTNSGRGQVLDLTPGPVNTSDWTGVYLPTGELAGGGVVTVSWEQYLGTTNHSIFIAETTDQSGWYGYQYPLSVPPMFHPNANLTDPGQELKAGVWQQFNLTLDFINGSVTSVVDGSPVTVPLYSMWNNFRGLDIEVFSTPFDGAVYFDNIVVTGGTGEIPEPATLALVAFGLAPALARRRRNR